MTSKNSNVSSPASAEASPSEQQEVLLGGEEVEAVVVSDEELDRMMAAKVLSPQTRRRETRGSARRLPRFAPRRRSGPAL